MAFSFPDYPVSEIIPELKSRLGESIRVILEAPPGAGKSTLVPLYLAGEPWLEGKRIIMLEPRRLAARAIALRMSELAGTRPGELIGYRVRQESRITKGTRVEVVTEGILTRLLQDDNALEPYGLVIFDEFHERSVHADLALTLLKEVQETLRPDLRLLLMSATLNTAGLSAFLKAPVITSSGRQYPVTEKYVPLPAEKDLAEGTAALVRRVLEAESGDILIFLPGSAEITKTQNLLEGRTGPDTAITPLFGDLSFSLQKEALLPRPGKRKVVLATSIAETSLTIEGIRVVIDSGLSRVPVFSANTGFSRLETVRVAADSAEQRKGRAGRL